MLLGNLCKRNVRLKPNLAFVVAFMLSYDSLLLTVASSTT